MRESSQIIHAYDNFEDPKLVLHESGDWSLYALVRITVFEKGFGTPYYMINPGAMHEKARH